MIQMGSLHDLARTETMLVWKPLYSQYCQLLSIKHQSYENSELE